MFNKNEATNVIEEINNIISPQIQKEFQTECSQLQFWISALKDIKSQYKQLIEIALKQSKYRNIYTISMNTSMYTCISKIKEYSNDPSNLYNNLKTVCEFLINSFKLLDDTNQNILKKIQEMLPNQCNNIDLIIYNILTTTSNTMSEIAQLKNDVNIANTKYNILKTTLDSAQLNKRKIENNPKTIYDEKEKERAEKEVINIVKELEDFLPKLKDLNKNLEKKEEIFNNHMKDTFELVVISIFKGLVKINQMFFVISKKLYESSNSIRNDIVTKINKYHKENPISLDDFSEKKYADSIGIFYEPIHFNQNYLLNSNKDTAINVISLCNSFYYYVETIKRCYKIRKRLLKQIKENISGIEENLNNFLQNLIKMENIQKQFIKLFDVYYVDTDMKKTWNLFNIIISSKIIFLNTIEKFIDSNLKRVINNYIENTKNEYSKFEDKWKKYQNKIIDYKNDYSKLYNKGNKKNSKELIELENKIKNKLNTKIFEFLSEKVSQLRQGEEKYLDDFIENIKSIETSCKILFDDQMEKLKLMIQNTTENDIFDDLNKIFKFFFERFELTNYETFMDYMKIKIAKMDFEKEMLLNDDNNNSILRKDTIYSGMNLLPNNIEGYFSSDSEKDEKEINLNNNLENNENDILNKDDEKFSSSKISQIEKLKSNNKIDVSEINNPNNNLNKENESNINNINFKSNNNKTENNLNFNESNVINTLNEKNKNDENNILSSSFSMSSDEGINFINNKNFETNKINPYQNFKPVEIKGILNKINLNENNNEEKLDELLKKDIENEEILQKYKCKYLNEGIIHPKGILYITNYKIAFINKENKLGLKQFKIFIPLTDIVSLGKETSNGIKKRKFLIIKTERISLKFYKLENRDSIIKKVNELINLENNNNNNNNDEDNNDKNVKKILTKYDSQLIERNLDINEKLKNINFFERLKEIDQKRLDNFYEIYKDEKYSMKKPDFYSANYVKNEFLSNMPVYFVADLFFNPNRIIDSLNQNKGFFESIFLNRGDIDLTTNIESDYDKDIPDYYKDCDLGNTLFSEIDENNLDNLLKDVENWSTNFTQIEFNFVHPMKKMMIGPDRITMKNLYKIYWISPMSFNVDMLSFGSDFPYADTFVTCNHARFFTDFKFNQKTGLFNFKTFINVNSQIYMLKSCVFESMLKVEGYKNIEQDVKFSTVENMKNVSDIYSQEELEMFIKLSDEKIRRNIHKYKGENINIENIEENKEENNEENNNEAKLNKKEEENKLNNNNNIKKGLNISEIIFGPNRNNYLLMIGIIIFMLLRTFLDKNSNFIEKFTNVILTILIGVLFFKISIK